MIIANLILAIVFLIVLIKSADYAIRYSSRISKILQFPEFIVSFFIIAVISVMPEATIAIASALNGEPELGLGTLLGSNVADLTLIFGIVALFSSKGIKIKSKILKNNFFYLILLLFPLVLGFDGKFSRIDGLILVIAGVLFFVKIYLDRKKFRKKFNNTPKGSFLKNLILLMISITGLLISATLTVRYSTDFAYDVKIPVILIGVTIIALGTGLPELIFSIKAIRKNHHDLALGDILGTVITDATIVLGAIALISPFSYNPINIYIVGGAMVLGGIFTMFFMKSDKTLTKIEGLLLILFYILFVFVEFFMNKISGN